MGSNVNVVGMGPVEFADKKRYEVPDAYLTATVPVLAPKEEGLKDTVTVQVAFAASEEPQSFVSAN